MMERASALLFAAFVSFAAIAALSGGKKQRIRWFIAFSAVAIVGPGILHREAWPFSRWQLFAYRYHPPVERVAVRAVDTAGNSNSQSQGPRATLPHSHSPHPITHTPPPHPHTRAYHHH